MVLGVGGCDMVDRAQAGRVLQETSLTKGCGERSMR